MSDTPGTPQESHEEAEHGKTPEPPQGDAEGGEELSLDDLRADRDKWKALSRKNEDRAKANSTAAQEWAKHRDSLKTVEERADEQRTELSKERDSALSELAVLRAVVKHGLSEDDVELLEGLPADVVEQRAEKLANRIPKTRKPAPDPSLGRETDPSGGSAGGDFLRNAFRGR